MHLRFVHSEGHNELTRLQVNSVEVSMIVLGAAEKSVNITTIIN